MWEMSSEIIYLKWVMCLIWEISSEIIYLVLVESQLMKWLLFKPWLVKLLAILRVTAQANVNTGMYLQPWSIFPLVTDWLLKSPDGLLRLTVAVRQSPAARVWSSALTSVMYEASVNIGSFSTRKTKVDN